MKAHPLIQSFNAGELSPWLHARTAFAKYPFGLAQCENLIPIIEGAVTRRAGTRYIAEVKDSSKETILKGFVFSTIQAYMLEIGEGYIRFFRHQGQIVVSGVSAWVVTTVYAVGDLVSNGGTNYYCYAAHTAAAGDEPGVGANWADYWHALEDDVYEIPNPYSESDLADLRFVQSADVLYIYHPDYAIRKLTRTAHTNWTLTTPTIVDGPYLDVNSTATTMEPSHTTGSSRTVTASATTGINDGQGFLSTDVGRLIRISNPASAESWGYATITAVGSTTSVTVTINRDFAQAAVASVDWALGSWSETTGYPKVGVFFQQRLVSAGTTDQPQTVWFSQSDDFENMSPDSVNGSGVWDGTVEDDDAFARTISSDEVNAVVWLASLRKLVVGTSGGEWIFGHSGVAATPSDARFDRNTKVGCAEIPPVIVGNKVLFIQSAERKLIELGFSFDDDSYREVDLSRLARHITYGGITSMFYAREPFSVVGCIRSDGNLACMTYNREEDVVSWFPVSTDGSFERADTIPGANGAGQVQSSKDRNEVWAIVNRTIDGGTVRYVEMFERDFEYDEETGVGHDQEDAYYADSLLTYDSTSTTSITGLDHLEGEEVAIWADGYKQTNQTVASGAITLTTAASVVQVGLPYTHKLKTLKLDFGARAGSAVGKMKNINALVFVLLNSHSMKYGRDANNLIPKDFREVADAMDSAVDLFTGEFAVDFDGGWKRDSRIYLEDDAPAPFTLLAIAPEMYTNEQL